MSFRHNNNSPLFKLIAFLLHSVIGHFNEGFCFFQIEKIFIIPLKTSDIMVVKQSTHLRIYAFVNKKRRRIWHSWIKSNHLTLKFCKYKKNTVKIFYITSLHPAIPRFLLMIKLNCDLKCIKVWFNVVYI